MSKVDRPPAPCLPALPTAALHSFVRPRSFHRVPFCPFYQSLATRPPPELPSQSLGFFTLSPWHACASYFAPVSRSRAARTAFICSARTRSPSIIQELQHTQTPSRPSRYYESWHSAVNPAHCPASSLTVFFLLASPVGVFFLLCAHWISAVLSSPSVPLAPASLGCCAAAHVHASAAGEHGVVVVVVVFITYANVTVMQWWTLFFVIKLTKVYKKCCLKYSAVRVFTLGLLIGLFCS
jgi:hypothetical protein